MEKDILAGELACFCFVYGILGKSIEENIIRSKIESGLENIGFIKALICTLALQSSDRSYIDVEKLKELLLELERIRLELSIKNITVFDGNSWRI